MFLTYKHALWFVNLQYWHALICKSMKILHCIKIAKEEFAWIRKCYSAAILETTLTFKTTSKKRLVFKGCRNLPLLVSMYSNANYVRSITLWAYETRGSVCMFSCGNLIIWMNEQDEVTQSSVYDKFCSMTQRRSLWQQWII